MAYPPEMRDKIRRTYVFNQMSLEVVAAMMAVSFGTARRWKKEAQDAGDDWDRVRAAQVMAGGSLEAAGREMLISLIIQFQTATEKLNTDTSLSAEKRVDLLASLSDALSKATSANKKILPQTSELATALTVIKELGDFINQRFPQHNTVFVEVLEAFSERLEHVVG
jgi:uncharacterized protein YjcR